MRIRNVAVIVRLEGDFEPGLNLWTGEPGAGKSILIDALGLVLGSRASSDLVRSGADTAVVEAGFELKPMPRSLARRLKDIGVEVEDEVVIRRELQTEGRGKVTVNGVAAARQLLREIAPYLADIHGQGDSSSLLRPEAGLDILDRFGGSREDRREAREHRPALARLPRRQGSSDESAPGPRAPRPRLHAEHRRDPRPHGRARKPPGAPRTVEEEVWREPRRGAGAAGSGPPGDPRARGLRGARCRAPEASRGRPRPRWSPAARG